ncbi:MAG: hypothetical protein LC112_15895 [Flavobacteriales bacterium]|nr:hypothetical protein [Flavobacteriales bacterium]
MEIITLVATAFTLAKPFLEKIGEGTSRKIGEEIWNLIKKPFSKEGKDISNLSIDEIKFDLTQMLSKDSEFKKEFEEIITNAQLKIDSVNQNIQNNGSIEKQVNIGSNIGNISL